MAGLARNRVVRVVVPLLGLVVAAALAAPVFTAKAYLSLAHKSDRVTACTQAWANTYTARTERITDINSERNDALSRLELVRHQVFAAVAARPFNRATFERALAADTKAWLDYEQKTAELNRALAANPIPPAPQYLCK